jgi:hypothetical protein
MNITDLATGSTHSNPAGNNTGLLGMFNVKPGDVLSGNIWLILGAVAGTIGAAWVLGQLGFSANFIIPLFILMAMIFMNLFFFPLNFLLDTGMPSIIKVFIPVILNLLFILAVMDFMRGGA